MKSFKRLLFVLLIFAVVPFSIFSVYSNWTYYEGAVEEASVQIKVNLGEFNYEPEKPLLPNFEDTPSGHKNSSTIDKIIDSNTGANNHQTPINTVLQKKLPSSGFVTSIDKITTSSSGYPVLTGKDIQETLGISLNSHFLIHKIYDNISIQTWNVYTTDFPIDDLEIIETVDENGNPITKYNHDYIYDVYRSTLKWEGYIGYEDEAKYTLVEQETVLGYATPTINEINNPDHAFFSPSTFHVGKYVQNNGLSIEGPSEVYTDQIMQYNVVFDPIDTTDKNVTWASSNNKIARIDNNGVLTPISTGQVTITATSNYKNNNKASFVVNIKQHGDDNIDSIKIIGPNYGNVISGRDYQLKLDVSPSSVSNKNAIWSTSDSSIATIDDEGLLTVKETRHPGSRFTVYARSVLNNEIVDSVEYIVQLPNSSPSFNGKYEIEDGKMVKFNARQVELNSSGVVYPSGTTSQAIRFTIPKSSNPIKVKLEYTTDGYIYLPPIYVMDSEFRIEEYTLGENTTFNSSPLTDLTYFVTFSGDKPIEYKVIVQ